MVHEETNNFAAAWSRAAPDDVLGGVEGLKGADPLLGRMLSPQGVGTDRLLAWAKEEAQACEATEDPVAQQKHGLQAVTHARRALDCLVDMYLVRDFLDVRLHPRANFSTKLELLSRHPHLDVPKVLIGKAVSNIRNLAEHSYEAPSVEDAVLAVEAALAACSNLREQMRPDLGPYACPVLSVQTSYRHGTRTVTLKGFPQSFAFWWKGSDGIARLGVGRGDRGRTDVLYCEVSDMTELQHMWMISWWHERHLASALDEGALVEIASQGKVDRPVQGE